MWFLTEPCRHPDPATDQITEITAAVEEIFVRTFHDLKVTIPASELAATFENSPAPRKPADLIEEITAAAPPGRLNNAKCRKLRELSAELVAASDGSVTEFRRYLSIMDRRITVPEQLVSDHIAGRTVLVTGAAGCIGTALVRQLARFGPGRLVTLDTTTPPFPVDAHYQVDVRDQLALVRTLAEVRPDIVFHLAAQRDPGLAERAVHRTVSTNVFGTRNIVSACAKTNVDQVVLASTGKALRPYTADVYAATKRAGELIVADAAARGMFRASAVRFTHVVDNSIVLARFRRNCRRDQVLRLHSPHDMFYAQSASESAQLLLAAALTPGGTGLDLHAIRDLGWPFSPLDLAIGVMADDHAVPLRITGHDPGYEAQSFPGLYDPAFAGEVSPLLNSFEAPHVAVGASPDVDRVACRTKLDNDVRREIDSLAALCKETREPDVVRQHFDRLSMTLFEATLANVPLDRIRRVAALTEPHAPGLNDTNQRIYHRLQQHLKPVATRVA